MQNPRTDRDGSPLARYRTHAIAAAILALAVLAGWHDPLRNALADLRFRWLQHDASGQVVVAAIDRHSIEKIGVWPWPRKLHAQLLRRLADAGAADIAFDVDFSSPSDPKTDADFAEALRSAGSVVLPSMKQPGRSGRVEITRPLPQFHDASWPAVVNVGVAPDGRVRNYPLGDDVDGEFVPSMSAMLAGRHDRSGGSFPIDFAIRAASVPTVSYVDVLEGDPAALARLKDKKIIVGATALELGDRFSIPNGEVVSGPVLQALAAESLIQGRPLRWTSQTLSAAVLCALVMATLLARRRLNLAWRAAALAGVAVALEIAALPVQSRWAAMVDTSIVHLAIWAYLAAAAVDEIKREAERIRFLAEHDHLTALANRNTLLARLDGMIAAAAERNEEVALLVLGLHDFQRLNDVLGHACGDDVLRAVAARLTRAAGEAGTVARLGDDKFALAVPASALPEGASAFAETIVAAFETPVTAEGRGHRVRLSVGLAVHPDSGRTPAELLANGHLALSRAKTTSGRIFAFDRAVRRELEARLALEAELALASEREEFELFYQPQVRLSDRRVIGAEALIRWHHPERGLVPPGQFMPVVNATALSDRIASWVLRTGFEQARRWELEGRPMRVGINLSPSLLQSGDLAATVAGLLVETGVAPGLIELEVTEDILLQDDATTIETFGRIRALGVRLVLDDFGTGYAGLSYLKRFPLDGLKIDRTFVMDLLADGGDVAIVSATIVLAKQLGLSVIAEGIEDEKTAKLLLAMGCAEGQGYLFGRPGPATELTMEECSVGVAAA